MPTAEQPHVPREHPIARAFKTYENRWALLERAVKAHVPFGSRVIPWPLLQYSADSPPRSWCPSPEEVDAPALTDFLLNNNHSHGIGRKKRIQIALRRYHPDKFSKVLVLIEDKEEQSAVKDAAEALVRVLNALKETE